MFGLGRVSKWWKLLPPICLHSSPSPRTTTLFSLSCRRLEFNCHSWQERLGKTSFKRSWFPGNGGDMLKKREGSMSLLALLRAQSSIYMHVKKQRTGNSCSAQPRVRQHILSLRSCTGSRGNTDGRKGHRTQGPARAQHGSLWHWAVRAAFWKDTRMEVESDVSYKTTWARPGAWHTTGLCSKPAIWWAGFQSLLCTLLGLYFPFDKIHNA